MSYVLTVNAVLAPPMSHVSVDVVAVRAPRPGQVVVGIARRQLPPFRGRLALPGVLLTRGERLREAATRALVGKLGVDAVDVLALGQVATFDEPSRDPRGPTLSVALWAALSGTASAALAEWVPLDEVPPLAFDHDRIVADARQVLADKLWRDVGLTRALTGRSFAASEAVELTETLTGRRPDAANLNKTLANVSALRRTEERRRVQQTGRPAVVWAWDEPPESTTAG
jgi:8-oxo-dGTP diphosphatase